jgi:hypothetical protein
MKLSCLQPGHGGDVHRGAVRLVCEQTLAGGADHFNFWFSRLRQE